MISVLNVTKVFGKVEAVQDLSLEVIAGESFALLGPNGAGKSTTIKMLTTMLRPTSGRLLLAGYDTVTHASDARRQFGVVFQEPSLDDQMTALENMNLHAHLYGMRREPRLRRVQELLGLVGLWDSRARMVKEFSGGMRRRLEIARGLLHSPPIMILDEPTLGLDSQTRHQMWSHIQQMKANSATTVFFTTHYLEEAEKFADRVAIIDHGRLNALGTPEQIKQATNSPTLDAAYLALTGTAIREVQAPDRERLTRARRLAERR